MSQETRQGLIAIAVVVALMLVYIWANPASDNAPDRDYCEAPGGEVC